MKKSIFLGFACLSLVIALIACAPATTLIPTKTPTSIPFTSTPTPTPTPTPKPATHTPPPATATPTPQPIAVVTADALNLRAGPGTVYDKKGLLHKGEKLNITARTATGDWIRVLADGTEGWVSATYVELLIPLDSIPVAVEIPPTPTALVLEPTSTPTSLPATPKTTPTPAGPVVLWEDDFNAGLKFRLSIDKSVGCAEFPISRSDISYKIVSDPSSPSQDKNVLEVQANTKEMGGLYVNTVTHRDVQFFDKHNYLLYGYFRKVDRDEPERYQPEQINVSLTLGIGHVDHFGEIVWKLNPYDPNYGTISTRTGDVPNLRTIVLFKLGDDSHWHYFEIEYHYELPDNFTIRRIRVDNNDVVLDPPIPTATMKKPWFYSKPTISAYLEVGNMYTNCDPAITKVAIARFDRIGVKLIPPSQ